MAITNFENNDINLNRFSGRTPSSICRRITVERELSSSDTPIPLSSCLTRGSIKPEHRLTQSSRSMVEMVYMRYPKKMWCR